MPLNLIEEEWRPIPGYEGLYMVSSDGRVKSLERVVKHREGNRLVAEKILRAHSHGRYGHIKVNLYKEGILWGVDVHLLVMLAFHGPCPEGMETRHLDNNPRNPKLSNLEYNTRRVNQNDRLANGTHNRGDKSGKAILTKEQVIKIKCALKTGAGLSELGRLYGVTPQAVWQIKNNRAWSWLIV